MNNFEIQKYYQKSPKFEDVYLLINLNTVKDGLYMVNLYEYKSIGTSWIAIYINSNIVTDFASFSVEQIPKEIKKSQLTIKILLKYFQNTSL